MKQTYRVICGCKCLKNRKKKKKGGNYKKKTEEGLCEFEEGKEVDYVHIPYSCLLFLLVFAAFKTNRLICACNEGINCPAV